MSLFHPLLAIVEKRDSLERVPPGVQLCSVPPRCQADAEMGAGGQEGGGLLLPRPGRWQGLRVTGLVGKSVPAGVARPSKSFRLVMLLQQSPGEETFKGDLYSYGKRL